MGNKTAIKLPNADNNIIETLTTTKAPNRPADPVEPMFSRPTTSAAFLIKNQDAINDAEITIKPKE